MHVALFITRAFSPLKNVLAFLEEVDNLVGATVQHWQSQDASAALV
jgi:hypothetical protein